ncbi:MAG: hypothetical protein ICV72_12070, partial [Aldersonia sp.]|nr:hypothetical protein [Aldersonia sp.]
LPDLTVRHAGRPHRGPWPVIARSAGGVVVLGVAFLLWRRLRRRRIADGTGLDERDV